MDQLNPLLYILIALLVLTLLVAAIVKIVFAVKNIKATLSYLNIEIGRTEGEEKEYWKKRKRQLLLSLIPFVKY